MQDPSQVTDIYTCRLAHMVISIVKLFSILTLTVNREGRRSNQFLHTKNQYLDPNVFTFPLAR